ncbi:hypothetical protein RF11_12154 [Thelohanellus kitauei]|uniref:Uncharacterized protein n=1 Tax=Thelohanellus kitauei TaxID=669202 RepID=A0A0C2MEY0_THEKT|nr:hypothetical protein RF11_12154 [Thelohanellus kitauei]
MLVWASHGLLSQNELTFNECQNVLIELFAGPYNPTYEERPETNSILVRLYNSHVLRIVEDCIEAILTRRNISFIKGCGRVLHMMKNVELYGIEPILNTNKKLLSQILEIYSDEIRSNKKINRTIIKMLNASSEESAMDFAVAINYKLYSSR